MVSAQPERDGVVRRVVVADDDEDIARVIAMTLEDAGYAVFIARDGEEARDLVLSTVPDLLVLDWMMPKLDGPEVITALRAHPRTREVPIVMLSAKTSDDDVWEGWQAGVDYYLTKPFDPEELLRFVASTERAAMTGGLTG
jgi:two-component system, OmpR family, alkaline phosphatase synthesis response regulator PhoP